MVGEDFAFPAWRVHILMLPVLLVYSSTAISCASSAWTQTKGVTGGLPNTQYVFSMPAAPPLLHTPRA